MQGLERTMITFNQLTYRY